MMSKVVSTGKSLEVNSDTDWDSATAECLQLLAKYEAEAARLRVSIEYFQNRKRSGDPFPGITRLRERGLAFEEDTSSCADR